MAAQQQEIQKNRAVIDAAIARFGQVDEYYIKKTPTAAISIRVSGMLVM